MGNQMAGQKTGLWNSPSQGRLCPIRMHGNVWGHVWLSRLGRFYYWCLAGGGQECCYTSLKHSAALTVNHDLAPNVRSTQAGKPWGQMNCRFGSHAQSHPWMSWSLGDLSGCGRRGVSLHTLPSTAPQRTCWPVSQAEVFFHRPDG